MLVSLSPARQIAVSVAAALLSSLGVQFTTNGTFNGTVYIDSVNF